jgi:hypothetical protein
MKAKERQVRLDFIRDRDALSDRITNAKDPFVREHARHELRTRMNKFLKDTGTAQAEVEALIRANAKHEAHLLEAKRSADVSPYMAMSVIELRKLAKGYGLSLRGNNANLAHAVAVFERAKAIAPDFAFTAEELMVKASVWSEVHNNKAQIPDAQWADRGTVREQRMSTAQRLADWAVDAWIKCWAEASTRDGRRTLSVWAFILLVSVVVSVWKTNPRYVDYREWPATPAIMDTWTGTVWIWDRSGNHYALSPGKDAIPKELSDFPRALTAPEPLPQTYYYE